MTKAAPKETLIEVAITRLSEDIVSGDLPPDHKLQMADLKARYQISASPLREALAKLSSLGFVVFDSRRGFRVAAMSQEDLADLTGMRQLIELAALRASIESGDDEWEVGVIAATARLQRLKARKDTDATPGLDEIERAHRLFHQALLTGCHSRRLATLQAVFYDQAQRYRHVMISQELDLNKFVEVHEQLANVVLSRNYADAAASLSEHIGRTLQIIYPSNKEEVSDSSSLVLKSA
jgi:DNA-binding GntR family transcriptional regulator